jgi:tight adherence protein B
MPLRVGEYLMMRWIAALLAMLLVWQATHAAPMALTALVGGYFLPVLYVKRRQAGRVSKFDDQLVDALVLLANSLKSGYSFLQGVEAIAREMPEPIGVEFDEVLREIRMGGSVEEALMNMSERVRSADFELVVTAMVIQRQVGGNLTEVLASIAYTVRERHRILREVRVLTAQERASGYLVAALPVMLVFLLSLLNPRYIGGMWGDSAGRLMLGAGFVLAGLGLVVIRKMMDIDV